MDNNKNINSKNEDPDKSSKNEDSKENIRPFSFTPHAGNKFGLFISSVSPSSLTNLLTLIIIIAAIPLTIFIARQSQDTRQRAGSENIYITVFPDTAKAGENISISASGSKGCLEKQAMPDIKPEEGLSCSPPDKTCFTNNICVANWTCKAFSPGIYTIEISNCQGGAKVTIHNQ